MRNKKLVILTMAACITAGLAAGCGAKSADIATTAVAAAESTAAEPAESSAEVTEAAGDSTADEAYEPVTITLNLERSERRIYLHREAVRSGCFRRSDGRFLL